MASRPSSTLDENRLGQPDEAQLAFAVTNEMCLLTHNRSDFAALAEQYFAAGQSHFGIIIAGQHKPHETVRRLLLILNKVTAEEIQNQVFYI